MASEIRVNQIQNRSGLSTVTFSDTGAIVSGIVTANSFSGSGANLTSLPAANITGTLPAISGANLTSLPAQATIANNADNRVITGGSGVNLNGEAGFTFNGSLASIVNSSGSTLEVTTNTGSADATLRLSEGATGSTSNGGGMFYSGADNKLYITCGTNSTTKRVTINRDDGKIGINQTSPAHKLHVEDGSSGVIVAKQTTNNGGYNIFEGDASDGTTKFYVTHNGRVGAADGIIFGTDTAAGNILNDYEEGNWSPTDLGGSAYNVAGGAVGKYVKVGGVVHAWAQFGTSTSGNVAVGDRILIGDLPFNVNTVNNPAATVTINYSASTYSTTKAHVTSLNEIAFTVTQTTGHPRSGAGYYVQVTYFTNS